MRVAVGADHRGVELRRSILGVILEAGHEAIDLGTHGDQPVDYPDIAQAVAQAVSEGDADRGVIICGSGVGASIAANKVPGARAGLCHDTYSARQGVEHDDMNILALGARVIGDALAAELVRAFLAATFTGEDRHRRRLSKIEAIERRVSRGSGEMNDDTR